MIRGDKVAVAHLQSVTAIRVVNRKEAKLLVPILIEGAGTGARRELAFGKGFSCLHAFACSLSANKKSTPNGVLFLILLVRFC